MRIGLVLGGGGVRGAAHLGVLRELGRLGIKPAALAGTSSGGLVAALVACGCEVDELEALTRSLNPASAIGIRFPFQRPKPTLLGLLEEYIQGRSFEDLPIPLTLTAFDVTTGQEIHMREGPLMPALRATIALPGLFAPTQLDGRVLVDGGIITSIPIPAITDVDKTIAVDVRSELPPYSPMPRWRRNRWILLRAHHVLTELITEVYLKEADVVIRPEIQSVGVLDFKATERCIRAGEEATREKADEIRALLPSTGNLA